MVQSVTPEDDMKIFDRKNNAKRFAYKNTMVKVDPWKRFKPNNGNENADNTEYEPCQQYKPTSENKNRERNKALGFNLDNVWSIRNNVPFSKQQSGSNAFMKHEGTNASRIRSSLYSRYTTNKENSEIENSSMMKSKTSEKFKLESSISNKDGMKMWNSKSKNYSFKNNDTDDEFNYSNTPTRRIHSTKRNSIINNSNTVSSSHRRLSAINHSNTPSNSSDQLSAHESSEVSYELPISDRIERYHDGYLKSRGLGKYASAATIYLKHENGWKDGSDDNGFY